MTQAQRAARMNAALARALAHNLCSRVELVIEGDAPEYLVPSTSEPRRWYVVVVTSGRYSCNCTAGALGTPCQHSAAVWRVTHNLRLCRVTVGAA